MADNRTAYINNKWSTTTMFGGNNNGRQWEWDTDESTHKILGQNGVTSVFVRNKNTHTYIN